MGCQTGFYLLVRDISAELVLESVKQVLNLILSHNGQVFGASKEECGNYQNLDLELAKIESRTYLQVLNTSNNTFAYL
jgi:S-ribosylhomocysteine lyase